MEFHADYPVHNILVAILVAVVLGQSVYFLVKALRRSKQIGMNREKITKTMKIAAVFSIAVSRMMYKRGVL